MAGLRPRTPAPTRGTRALTRAELDDLADALDRMDDDRAASIIAATGRDPAPYLRFVNPGDKRGLLLPPRDLPGEVDLVAALSAESYMRL